MYTGEQLVVTGGVDLNTFFVFIFILLGGTALYNLAMIIISQIKLSKLKTAVYLIKKGHNAKIMAQNQYKLGQQRKVIKQNPYQGSKNLATQQRAEYDEYDFGI